MPRPLSRRSAAGLLAGLALLVAAAPAPAPAATAEEIDAAARAALERLHAEVPETRELAARSVGILVFPEIVKGGVIVGGQYGEGALLVDGATQGYYSIAAASFGLQVGGQTFAQALFVLTEAGLQYLEDTRGFELGVGPTIVGGDKGWTRQLGTTDIQGDIAPVFFGQQGLMVGGGIQGSKITPIER